MFNFGSALSQSAQQNNQGATPSTPSLFSFNQPAAQPAPALSNTTPSSTFSFNAPSQQPMTPQTSTGTTYPRETNFMDLPADLRQNIEALEKTIQAHADAARPFSARPDPTAQLQQIDSKLNLLEEKIAAYSSQHAQQSARISSLKKATSAHWRYAESVARTIEASRHASPQENGKLVWSRAFAPNDATATHFDEILIEMKLQIEQAEQIYESIRRQIDPLTMGSETYGSPSENVKIILKNEQDIITALNRRYTHVKEEIEGMRKVYRSFCLKYRNDSRDPFVSRVERVPETKVVPASTQLPAQPVSAMDRPSVGMTTSFGSQPSGSLANLLPSATTGLAPIRPATSSLFSGFSFGK